MAHTHDPASLAGVTLRRPSGGRRSSLQRVERCWLRLLLTLVIASPVIAVLGVGGTLLGLIGFLVIFGVASARFISPELRPAVSLVSSGERRHVRRV